MPDIALSCLWKGLFPFEWIVFRTGLHIEHGAAWRVGVPRELNHGIGRVLCLKLVDPLRLAGLADVHNTIRRARADERGRPHHTATWLRSVPGLPIDMPAP